MGKLLKRGRQNYLNRRRVLGHVTSTPLGIGLSLESLQISFAGYVGEYLNGEVDISSILRRDDDPVDEGIYKLLCYLTLRAVALGLPKHPGDVLLIASKLL